MKLLIVGGVAGGASAAARARRLCEDAEIILFERGGYVSFANCGLPYHLGGEIQERDNLLVATPEMLTARLRLDVRIHTEVVSIDRADRRVRIREQPTGRTYEEAYDKLILAPGASPIKPDIPGIDAPGVFTLRSMEDMDRIKTVLDQNPARIVVVGGGFIGLEVTENLVRRGIATSVIQRDTQVLSPWDPEMTTPVARHLADKGVDLHLNDTPTRVERSGSGLRVFLQSGNSLKADAVILGIGVRPESHLAEESGLEVSKRGGIKVNEFMQTSDPHVYAVGDAVEVTHAVTGERIQIPLAGPANRQGRIAADHIFGRLSRYRGTQGTAILRVFDLTLAMTGASEKLLKGAGLPYRKVYLHPPQHVGYYPGAQHIALKLLFAPDDGKILGAQALGGEGVDKRIDVLAIALQAGLSVYDLEEAELAYSPQYGSAKDPINMAGFVAAGVLRGDQPQAQVEDLNSDAFLLDVRSPKEFASGHIPGAVNIPIEVLRERLKEVPLDRKIIAYCHVGQRGYLATRLLNQKGYTTSNLSGGFLTYRMHS